MDSLPTLSRTAAAIVSLPPQSTYIYRAPQCMSPRRNWDSPTPLAAGECSLPPGPMGGGTHPPAAKGVGETQFRRLEKKLSTLPTLCLPPSLSTGSAPFALNSLPYAKKSSRCYWQQSYADEHSSCYEQLTNTTCYEHLTLAKQTSSCDVELTYAKQNSSCSWQLTYG